MDQLSLAVRLANIAAQLAAGMCADKQGLSQETGESFRRAILAQAGDEARALVGELLAEMSPETRATAEEGAPSSTPSTPPASS